MASKYFGNANPMGELLVINDDASYKVTGVIADCPLNSHLQFDFLRSIMLYSRWGIDLSRWRGNSVRTYVLMKKNSYLSNINQKIAGLIKKHVPQDERPLFLWPIARLHLHRLEGGGPITYVYIFSAAAFLILIIACINFMNLATARSLARAREIGIRKTIGAHRSDLIRQFFGESFFLTFFSLALALLLAGLFLPVFNSLAAKTLTLHSFLNLRAAAAILAVGVFTALLAGSYPALFLSAFQPEKILKGHINPARKAFSLRKALVVFQFALSIFLIIGTLVVFKQVRYMKSRGMGYDAEHVVELSVSRDSIGKFWAARGNILNHPDILNMTLGSNPPYVRETNYGLGDVHWQGQRAGQQTRMHVMSVEYEFLNTFRMHMAEGRFFSCDFSTDPEEAWVVNQSAIRAMEMESPLGKQLVIGDRKGVIIGVTKDFHFRSMHHAIEPLALRIIPQWMDSLFIRINGDSIAGSLAFLEERWKEIYPGFPFEYKFMDESIGSLYRSELRTGAIFKNFAFLAVFISCLGLLGLASHTAAQKTKEIGVRKVMGASSTRIFILMSKEFIKWVLIANVITWPAAYFAAKKWLQNFAFRTGIGVEIFILSALLAVVIALLTVAYRSIRAALVNPVTCLRHE
jgi:ABC-type antimicrobial peptide transport system permease subunit